MSGMFWKEKSVSNQSVVLIEELSKLHFNVMIIKMLPAANHIELRHVQQVQHGGGHEVDLFQ